MPAPATLELLKGIPVYGSNIEAELITPTGAVIISTLAENFGQMPPMKIDNIGYGAGQRDLLIPNLLRVSVGVLKDAYGEDAVSLIQTNIDDMNPEFYEHITGIPFSNSRVAGAGTGRVPWLHFTKPLPRGKGEEYTLSIPKHFIPATAPTTSIIVSKPPSS